MSPSSSRPSAKLSTKTKAIFNLNQQSGICTICLKPRGSVTLFLPSLSLLAPRLQEGPSNSCPLLVHAGEKRGLSCLCDTRVLLHNKYTREALSYITHLKREHSGKEMKGCRAQLCKRKIIRACLSHAQACRGEKQGTGRLLQRELGVRRARQKGPDKGVN